MRHPQTRERHRQQQGPWREGRREEALGGDWKLHVDDRLRVQEVEAP